MEKIILISSFAALCIYDAAFIAYFTVTSSESKRRLSAYAIYVFGVLVHAVSVFLCLKSCGGVCGVSISLIISSFAAAFFPLFVGRGRYAWGATVFLLPVISTVLGIGAILYWYSGNIITETTDGSHILLMPVHALPAIASIGVLGYAVCVSILYVWKGSMLKRSPEGSELSLKLPPLQALNKIHSVALKTGFLLLMIAVVVGVGLAHEKWKGSWPTDPVVYFTGITVAWYAVLLLIRTGRGLSGRRAAVASVMGFLLLVFTFLGIIFWFPRGRHPFLEWHGEKPMKSTHTAGEGING